jgi:hypothetical protein
MRLRSSFPEAQTMTVLRAFAIILGAGGVGSLVGALIGYMLAVVTPGYYAGVFPGAAARPGFNPVDIGVGLGLTQGLVAGVCIGCVVVLAVAIASRFRLPAVTDQTTAMKWNRSRPSEPSSAVQPAPTDVTST